MHWVNAYGPLKLANDVLMNGFIFIQLAREMWNRIPLRDMMVRLYALRVTSLGFLRLCCSLKLKAKLKLCSRDYKLLEKRLFVIGFGRGGRAMGVSKATVQTNAWTV